MMTSFDFHCPGCSSCLSAESGWEGQITECPHCGVQLTVPQANPSIPVHVVMSPPVARAAIELKEPPTVRASESAAMDRLWENDYFRFLCHHCGKPVRIQGLMFEDPGVACPECGHGISLRKVRDLTPETQALYRLPVSSLLFSYRGRVGRSHCWLLAILPTLALPMVVAALFLPDGEIRELNDPTMSLLMLAWFVPIGLPVTIKRLHDRGKSGHWAWLLVLTLVPNPGPAADLNLIELVAMFAKVVTPILFMVTLGLFSGDRRVNQYGPPPALIRYR